MDHIFAIHSHS